ncbi:MAG: type II toxin-antitoxin system Phd/YefM family antitoxin [Hyphomicrobiales bacterium]|nr:type II toxin-antitoxin system Phd/YefM family antitoxin [Hyphomicrobiales bacterium]
MNLADTLDSVADDHQPIIIARDCGNPVSVLTSLEYFVCNSVAATR